MLGAVVLAGCGGPGVPAGWTEQEVGGVTVAHPEDWVPLPEAALGSGELWRVGLQDAPTDAEATVQLLVGPDLGEHRYAAEAMGVLSAGAVIGLPFEDWRSEGRSELDVPGATSAERWDFSYEGDPGGGRVEGVWVVVADVEDRRTGGIQLTGDPLDPEVVADVVDSLRFRGTS
ncbi:hypothetical protein [Jannaschia sp. R86511]|uniref:hypothetical protein n=1 Tax=Jannaschia sp. R86511 TaxID=3093853 RepID=UPI0036D428AA